MHSQLGTIIFNGLFGPHDYENTSETKFAQIDLIGGKPDLQHTGEELDTITIGIRLHSSFCNPALRYEQFDSHRKNADILTYIDGYGAIIGNFVIEKIKRTVNQTDPYGEVELCELEVSLREYVDPNRSLTISSNAKDNAFALSAISLSIESTGPPPNPSADVLDGMAALALSSKSATRSISAANSDPANLTTNMKSAAIDAKAAYDTGVKTKDSVDNYVSQGVSYFGGVSADLSAINTTTNTMLTNILAGDLAAATADASTLDSSLNALDVLLLPATQILILR